MTRLRRSLTWQQALIDMIAALATTPIYMVVAWSWGQTIWWFVAFAAMYPWSLLMGDRVMLAFITRRERKRLNPVRVHRMMK